MKESITSQQRAEKIAAQCYLNDECERLIAAEIASAVAEAVADKESAIQEAEREAYINGVTIERKAWNAGYEQASRNAVKLDERKAASFYSGGFKAGAEAAARALEAQADSNTSEMQLARLAELIRALKTPEGGKS